MLRKILLILVLLNLTNLLKTKAQCNYRIKEFNSVAYLVPPGKSFRIRKNFVLPNRFSIQEIKIAGLSTNYKKSISNINAATYRHLKAIKNDPPPPSALGSKLQLNNDYGELYYNTTNIWIYLNFKQIFSNIKNENDDSLSLKFTAIAINMLLAIQSIEDKNWNPSIAQNIVEKAFEMIPSPQIAVNARYGYIQTANYSLLPLNPAIHLRVDHSVIVDSRKNPDVTYVQYYLDSLKNLINNVDSTKALKTVNITLSRSFLDQVMQKNQYRYEWSGQSIVSFSKIRFGDKEVFFKFDSFISPLTPRDGTRLPTNSYPDAHRRLLSSSIDPEFTSEISNSHYLFLFQKFLRENNSNSFFGTDMEDCCRPDRVRCNSLIFFRDDLNLLTENFQDCNSLTNYAVYGERSPIVPVIPVSIGTGTQYFPIGSTIDELISKHYISRNFKLSRLYNGRLTNVNSKNGDIVLLSGDNLINK
ncbi:hypothetical protein [Pedobacter gandavensis]|uniref:hypothetical protein n=1 Tax=Pedobacter gandavensis TaxID=2679963 RepID=UPI00292F66D7|nr:hypothetical protein [Pedobacter gandavensis]